MISFIIKNLKSLFNFFLIKTILIQKSIDKSIYVKNSILSWSFRIFFMRSLFFKPIQLFLDPFLLFHQQIIIQNFLKFINQLFSLFFSKLLHFLFFQIFNQFHNFFFLIIQNSVHTFFKQHQRTFSLSSFFFFYYFINSILNILKNLSKKQNLIPNMTNTNRVCRAFNPLFQVFSHLLFSSIDSFNSPLSTQC